VSQSGLFVAGFSGASFGQAFLQPRAAAVLTQHLIDEEEVLTLPFPEFVTSLS
jgi:hypothetical protein